MNSRIPAALIPILLLALKHAGSPEAIVNGSPAARGSQDSWAYAQIKIVFERPVPMTAVRRIVVSVPDKKLYLVTNGKIIRRYSALLGDAEEPTPIGEFAITERVRGNDTVIGKLWMGFYDPPYRDIYYGVHGRGPMHDETSTSGCVALENEDVADLFQLVAEGDPLTIIGTRVGALER